MTGCDRCGAQALAVETMCPVCGEELRTHGTAGIPVRRHGVAPPPPMEMLAAPEPTGRVSLPALGLGMLGTGLIAAGLGLWLW
jgi:hypothetical protein